MKALKELGSEDSAAMDREQNCEMAKEARAERAKRKQAASAALESNEDKDRRELFGSKQANQGKSGFMDMASNAFAGLAEEQHDVNEGSLGQTKNQMAENLNLLDERGQKIDLLSKNTDKVEENAAEYKSLAQKIREQSEKDNQRLSAILNPFGAMFGGRKNKK